MCLSVPPSFQTQPVVSFTEGLKRSVLKNRGEIGTTRSQETIKFMDEFKEQVEASEGKTFSEALQGSIYCESEPMPDLVITNIRLDGNKVKYTIKNQGEAATRGLIINILLVDGVPVLEDLIIGSIQPGQSLEKTLILSGPLKISPNTTIVVCADYENKVPESDEENNCLALEYSDPALEEEARNKKQNAVGGSIPSTIFLKICDHCQFQEDKGDSEGEAEKDTLCIGNIPRMGHFSRFTQEHIQVVAI